MYWPDIGAITRDEFGPSSGGGGGGGSLGPIARYPVQLPVLSSGEHALSEEDWGNWEIIQGDITFDENQTTYDTKRYFQTRSYGESAMRQWIDIPFYCFNDIDEGTCSIRVGYSFVAESNIPGAGGVAMIVQYFDQDINQFDESRSIFDLGSGSDDWERYEVSFPIPPGTRQVSIAPWMLLIFGGPSGGGEIRFDDITAHIDKG